MGVVMSKNPENESRLLQILDDHGGGIGCLATSEDCTVVATGSQDSCVRLWSTRGKVCEPLGVLRGHDGRITAVAFCDDCVLTGSTDKTVRCWNAITSQMNYVCVGHVGAITRVICTGDFIYSSSYDRTVRCWDFDSGECLRVFRGHLRGIFSVVYIPIMAHDDGSDDPSEEINCSRDVIVTGSGDGTAKSWSIETTRCLNTFKGHAAAVTCVTTDADGAVLFTGSMDQTIRSWTLETGEPMYIFRGHEGPVLYISVVNKVMYSTSSDHTARAWLKDVGDPLQVYKGHRMPVSKIIYHQGIVYTSCGDSVIRGFDARNGELQYEFIGHQYAVNALQVINKRLYSVSDDCTMRIWRIDSQRIHDDQKQVQKRAVSCPVEAEPGHVMHQRPASVAVA